MQLIVIVVLSRNLSNRHNNFLEMSDHRFCRSNCFFSGTSKRTDSFLVLEFLASTCYTLASVYKRSFFWHLYSANKNHLCLTYFSVDKIIWKIWRNSYSFLNYFSQVSSIQQYFSSEETEVLLIFKILQ